MKKSIQVKINSSISPGSELILKKSHLKTARSTEVSLYLKVSIADEMESKKEALTIALVS